MKCAHILEEKDEMKTHFERNPKNNYKYDIKAAYQYEITLKQIVCNLRPRC